MEGTVGDREQAFWRSRMKQTQEEIKELRARLKVALACLQKYEEEMKKAS